MILCALPSLASTCLQPLSAQQKYGSKCSLPSQTQASFCPGHHDVLDTNDPMTDATDDDTALGIDAREETPFNIEMGE